MSADSWIPALVRIGDLTRRLRADDGCEWDRAQTPESLTPYLIEEMHEALDSLQTGPREKLIEEIGDALYLWIFFLQLLEEGGRISIADAAGALEEKLIRRHPHVFSPRPGGGNDTSASAPRNWEIGKLRENREADETILPPPFGIPALLRARRVQEKAAAFGFDWGNATDVLPKVREEIGELETEVSKMGSSAAVQEELGDTIFALVNLARHLDQDPEAALRVATEKFRLRFNAMARSLEAAGHHIGDAPLDLMESHWNAVKNLEANVNRPEDRR